MGCVVEQWAKRVVLQRVYPKVIRDAGLTLKLPHARARTAYVLREMGANGVVTPMTFPSKRELINHVGRVLPEARRTQFFETCLGVTARDFFRRGGATKQLKLGQIRSLALPTGNAVVARVLYADKEKFLAMDPRLLFEARPSRDEPPGKKR